MFDARELKRQLTAAGCPENVANSIVESVTEMNVKNNDSAYSRQELEAVKFANEMTEKVIEKEIPENIAEEFLEVYSRIGKTSENLVKLGESMKEGIRLVSEMGEKLMEQVVRIDKLEKLAAEYIEAEENGYFNG